MFHSCLLQTEDLARMYRLFSRITKGLDPIADCFKEHVESEGMKLVKEVAEAVEAKKEKEAGNDNPCVHICNKRSKYGPVVGIWLRMWTLSPAVLCCLMRVTPSGSDGGCV